MYNMCGVLRTAGERFVVRVLSNLALGEEFVSPSIVLAPACTFHFDPILGRAGAIGTVKTFGDNAFHLEISAHFQECARVGKWFREAQVWGVKASDQFLQLLAPD